VFKGGGRRWRLEYNLIKFGSAFHSPTSPKRNFAKEHKVLRVEDQESLTQDDLRAQPKRHLRELMHKDGLRISDANRVLDAVDLVVFGVARRSALCTKRTAPFSVLRRRLKRRKAV